MTDAFRNPLPLYTGQAGSHVEQPAGSYRQPLPFAMGLAGKPPINPAGSYRAPFPYIWGLAGAIGIARPPGYLNPFPFYLGLSGVTSLDLATIGGRTYKKPVNEDEELLAVLAAALPVMNHRRGGFRRFSRSSSK